MPDILGWLWPKIKLLLGIDNTFLEISENREHNFVQEYIEQQRIKKHWAWMFFIYQLIKTVILIKIHKLWIKQQVKKSMQDIWKMTT